MSDVFYVRPIEPPITAKDLLTMAEQAGGCFDLHRVDWKYSFLAADGGRLLCWYRAPDAESARMALRELGSDMHAVWAGTVVGDGPSFPPVSAANIAAEVAFHEPLPPEQTSTRIAKLEGSGARLVRGFLSNQGTRAICVLQAADGQTARIALANARLPVQALWHCQALSPRAASSAAAS